MLAERDHHRAPGNLGLMARRNLFPANEEIRAGMLPRKERERFLVAAGERPLTGTKWAIVSARARARASTCSACCRPARASPTTSELAVRLT